MYATRQALLRELHRLNEKREAILKVLEHEGGCSTVMSRPKGNSRFFDMDAHHTVRRVERVA